jgi:NAD-dependent deacetylase
MTNVDTTIFSALRNAASVAVFTGAGVSAESGIPTFRDQQTGLWEHFDALELATPQAFHRDSALVWGWYEWRRAAVLAAQPNGAHRAIAAMSTRIPRFTLITQNVDDLHERAGSGNVLHLHGELSRPYCERCRRPFAPAEGIPKLPPGGARIEPPRCAACGSKVRPGVVWFGESLPSREWELACDAAKACDVFLCCGTSAVVQPAASLIGMAIGAGAATIQVNPNATDYDESVTVSLRGAAGVVLPLIVESTWGAG